MIQICIVNASKTMTDAEILAALPDLQTQISRDFAPHYCDAKLLFGKSIPAGSWGLIVLDHSDQAGALGYHDVTKDELPLGKVFAASDKEDRLSVTVTMSHEILEMLGDPQINLGAMGPGNKWYAYENCDAVEDDSLGYKIGNTLVSDFVLPSWFEVGGKTPFAFKTHLKKPFSLAPGGYIGVWTASKGWSQITAEGTHKFSQRARVGSRRERRMIDRDQWQISKS